MVEGCSLPALTGRTLQKSIKNHYQVFLVAGGYSTSILSSTETLVEGGQAWIFQQPLPTARYGIGAISLLDTVIMTGEIFLSYHFLSIDVFGAFD